MVKFIKKLLGKNEDRTRIQCKFTTVYPDVQLNEGEWFQEFNVGLLWDRKIICFD